MLNGDILGQFA